MKKLIAFLILTLGLTAFIFSETASIPGTISSLCYYDNFFYNLPESDFFFYFNDVLLYSEPPDETIYYDGKRDKYLRLAVQSRLIKEFIAKNGNPQNGTISIDLKSKDGFHLAGEFLTLLGLSLKKDANEAIQIQAAGGDMAVPYYAFCGIKSAELQKQLNSTGMLFFKLVQTQVHLPWDFKFLSSITGLKIDGESFFEQMIGNKRFSLLLAVLGRLADTEVNFIDKTVPETRGAAWRRIFLDKKMLMGMMVLSTALRVSNDRLLLPGGSAARKFWSALAGVDPEKSPMDFLAAVCGRDGGKLNYLYVFSFFLPEEKRRVLLFDYDEAKVQRLYQNVSLGNNEKLRENSFPRLDSFNYYSLLNILRTSEGRIVLPLGIPAWAQAMGLELPPQASECDFLESLLARSAKGSRKITLLQKFITVYSKFGERSQLLTPEFLQKMFREFESKNILIDFIEKIPMKKPETVDALFAWQERLLKSSQKDQPLFTALAQSLLETIAQAAWFASDRMDFDRVLENLFTIPWQRQALFDRLLEFIRLQSSVDSLPEVTDQAFLDFVLKGLNDQSVTIRDESYEWRVKEMYAAALSEMLSSQESCSLSVLSEIDRLLRILIESPVDYEKNYGRRLLDTFAQLPYPDFSDDAPKSLKSRVIAYDESDLNRDLQNLKKMSGGSVQREKVQEAVDAIKSDYLLPQLKDYLLSLAYALNAKSPKLRIFMNPNLARLHDFSEIGVSSWSSNSTPGNKTEFSGYYLKGGLSRLNLTFAVNWRSQLFEKNIFDSEQAQALVYNIMAMLPQPMIRHSRDFNALLVEFAVELLQKCGSNERIRTQVGDAARQLTAGYHYRKLNDFLSGKAADYYLFFSELQQIGLYFFSSGQLLDEFSLKDTLLKYAQMPLSGVIAEESDRWGNIFYNFNGSLQPKMVGCMPQEAAKLFSLTWLQGELITEYKVKSAYLSYKSGLPACLLGQFVFDYLNTFCKSVYSQNHAKDYYSTYFVLDVMNNAHLKNTVKKLQKDGFLRLK